MKRVLFSLVIVVILLTNVAVPALAASNDSSGMTIQVLVPDTVTPTEPKVYPVDVKETFTPNGSRMIVKTYELSFDESPGDIPRADFDREGWHYSLSDVTRDGYTYTACFIGTPIDAADTQSAAAHPTSITPLVLTLVAAALLAVIGAGYIISKKSKKETKNATH